MEALVAIFRFRQTAPATQYKTFLEESPLTIVFNVELEILFVKVIYHILREKKPTTFLSKTIQTQSNSNIWCFRSNHAKIDYSLEWEAVGEKMPKKVRHEPLYGDKLNTRGSLYSIHEILWVRHVSGVYYKVIPV